MIHIFIVNPNAGNKTFAGDLRKQLSEMAGLRYFVFNTRYAGYEREIVGWIQEIFHGEELRFYCCGGSGTMRNMLSGFDSLENTQIAFYPCGMSNDFLKVFGENLKQFSSIQNLVNGDVLDVDYIETNVGRALNTCSLGVDSLSASKLEDFRILAAVNSQLPYALSMLAAVFFGKPHTFEVEVDGKSYPGNWSEMILGNGTLFGGNCCFAEEFDPTDGLGNFVFAPNRGPLNLFKTLLALTKRDFETARKTTTMACWERFSIRRTDGEPFDMNFDGEIVHGLREVHARIVRRGLHLVVPKGVKP